jgi:hypothetical protein
VYLFGWLIWFEFSIDLKMIIERRGSFGMAVANAKSPWAGSVPNGKYRQEMELDADELQTTGKNGSLGS